jgi:hypothetical protein
VLGEVFMNKNILPLLLILALTSCNQSGSDNQEAPLADPPPSADEGSALVLGDARSPVLMSLDELLELTQHDGTQDLADFDVLILDGDTHTPGALKEHELVQEAVRSGMWVFSLDVTHEHKRNGLGHLLHAASDGKSHAYATRISQDAMGQHQVEVVELPAEVKKVGDVNDGLNAARAASVKQGMSSNNASFFADTFVEFIRKPVLQVQQTPSNIPAGLIYTTFYYTQIVPWTLGNAGRKDGSQEAGYQANYTFMVFLNNQDNPQGDFQFVLADTDLTANPTRGTGNFLNMKARSHSDWAVNTYDEMAWFQDRVIVEVEPYEDPNYSYTQGWITEGTSPETVNNQTQVTSGTSFNIGFQSPENPSASFTYNNSQTRTITDWKMTNESSGVTARWDYRTATPVDADITYNSCAQPFYDDGCYMSREPNDLSMNDMQLHTQAVWRTPSTVNNWVGFNATSEHHMADLYCAENFGFSCNRNSSKTSAASVTSRFGINLGAVIPIPIASLSFDPNPVTAGQTVTGTVTLQSPAQVDTPIQLQSNSQNATVLPTVTVKQGQTSTTFQVETNANNLASGNSTVATITAFYAQDFQTQLTVRAP